ncbi:MAG TPA: hypothetical protein VH396_00615 [Chitinophagaceae bacterium]|jgi:hypothetical protein
MSKTKIITALFPIFLLLSSFAFSQQTYDINGLRDLTNYWEINANIGGNAFLGDLGGNLGIGEPLLKDYMFKTNRLLGGISGTYNLNNYSALNFGLNFTKVVGVDSFITNAGGMERWRWYRNLNFKSNIVEMHGTATLYPIMLIDRKRIELHRLNPFLTTGIGVFHFRPQTNLNGEWVDLQPLSLEGEGFKEYPDRKPYKLIQIYIPINVGLKYYIDNKWAVSTGVLMRKTFTDYIDDISTTYINPQLFYEYFPAKKAALASQLYSRSRTPWKVKPDIEKADHKDLDSYITFFIGISIRLDKYTPFYYPKL